MTRLPAENRNIVGIDYDAAHPKYKVGPICSAPGCSRLADHAHHIWRRSFLTGDYGWVRLPDGAIVQNLCGLCWRCHQEVTENRAVIRWTGVRFVWDDELVMGMHLDPMPKVWGQAEQETVTSYGHEHGPGSVEKCPTCRRSIKKDGPKTSEKRPRKAWTITVPVDERENGADVLDTLVEECQKVFGHDETKAVRYFTVCQALALVLQHQEMLGEGS